MDGMNASSGPGANDAAETGSRFGDFRAFEKEMSRWILQMVDRLRVQLDLMNHRLGKRGRTMVAYVAVGVALLVLKLMGRRGTRFATVATATAYPLYASFKALEQGNDGFQKQWLAYWMCLGVGSALEGPASAITDLVPNVAALKLSFLVWLQRRGSNLLYSLALRPLLKSNETRLDAVIDTVSNQVDGAVGEVKRRFGSVKSAVEEETKRASLGP